MKHLKLRTKLLLSIIIAILFTSVMLLIISYMSLSTAYNRVIKVTKEKTDLLIKTQVECLVEVLDVNYKRFLDGEITEEDALENAKKIVRNSRYNNGIGYFWADMADGKNAVHIRSEVEGTNRYYSQDAIGNYFVQDTIKAGDTPNGDFFNFYFPKPGETQGIAKRGFVKKFEPYGWYIGTGNYEEDMLELIQNELNETNSKKFNSMIILISISIVLIILGITIMMFVIASITKPIQSCANRLKALSEGDLTSEVPVMFAEDETGILADSIKLLVTRLNDVIKDMQNILYEMSNGNLNINSTATYVGDFIPLQKSIFQILYSLNNTLAEINKTSSQVAEGSLQISQVSQCIAEGATEQASSVQRLLLVINEVSKQVEENADNALNVNQLSNETLSMVENSTTHINQLNNAMEQINNSSNKINDIIKTIDGITYQTNLLSLNAGIEAVRAGEAGKSFSVVANEIRTLATKSTEAAKDTAKLIESCVLAVENGVRIVEETSTLLLSIIERTKNSANLIGEISSASKEQAKFIFEIKNTIEDISHVITSNSAVAEESAASSEELNSFAQMLKTLIDNFKLNNINK